MQHDNGAAGGKFPSSQCNPSTKAAFGNAKVMDLKEFEVGLEVSVCGRAYWRGCLLANRWHKHPSLLALGGNAQNAWLGVCGCCFSLGSADVCVNQKRWWVKFCFR